jgi:hypothetical protein
VERVFEFDAAELLSGVHAPVGKPDPKGMRTTALRLVLKEDGRVHVTVGPQGPVEGVAAADY